jgi:hypothetical protein
MSKNSKTNKQSSKSSSLSWHKPDDQKKKSLSQQLKDEEDRLKKQEEKSLKNKVAKSFKKKSHQILTSTQKTFTKFKKGIFSKTTTKSKKALKTSNKHATHKERTKRTKKNISKAKKATPSSNTTSEKSYENIVIKSKKTLEKKIAKKNALKPKQIDMNLKYSNFSFLNKWFYKLRKSAMMLEQFNFWRSPLLWLQIFTVSFTTIYSAIFLYQRRTDLPNQISLFYFQQNPDLRYINTDSILILIAVNILFQLISMFISSKVFFKCKFLSNFVLINSIFSNIFLNIAIFKILRLTLF